MKSHGQQNHSNIHVFLTSEQSYKIAQSNKGGRDKRSLSSNGKVRIEKRRVSQLINAEGSYKDDLENTKLNSQFKKKLDDEIVKKMEFTDAINELMINFKTSEKNISEIKRRNDHFFRSDKTSNNKGDQNKKEEVENKSPKFKFSSRFNQIFNGNNSCKDLAKFNQLDYSRSEIKGISSTERKNNKLLKDNFIKSSSDLNQSPISHKLEGKILKNKVTEDVVKFQEILGEAEQLCKSIIPDIQDLAEAKKMSEKQCKRDNIALKELLSPPQSMNKRGTIFSMVNQDSEKQVHPFIKFLGYEKNESAANMSKWSRTEQVESRFLFHQYLQIEHKTFEQIQQEQIQKKKAENKQLISSISVPNLPKKQRVYFNKQNNQEESQIASNNNSIQNINQDNNSMKIIFPSNQNNEELISNKILNDDSNQKIIKCLNDNDQVHSLTGSDNNQLNTYQSLTDAKGYQEDSSNKLDNQNQKNDSSIFASKENLDSAQKNDLTNFAQSTASLSPLKEKEAKDLEEECLKNSGNQLKQIKKPLISLISPNNQDQQNIKYFSNKITSNPFLSQRSTIQKSNSGDILGVANLMTLQDLNSIKKRTEATKIKDSSMQNEIEIKKSESRQSRYLIIPKDQQGVTSINRDMLTYSVPNNNALKSWEKQKISHIKKYKEQMNNYSEKTKNGLQLTGNRNISRTQMFSRKINRYHLAQSDSKTMCDNSIMPTTQRNERNQSAKKYQNMSLMHCQTDTQRKLNASDHNEIIQSSSRSAMKLGVILQAQKNNQMYEGSNIKSQLEASQDELNRSDSQQNSQRKLNSIKKDYVNSNYSFHQKETADKEEFFPIKNKQNQSFQMISSSLIKRNHCSKLQLLDDKQIQKNQVKECLNQVLAVNNRKHGIEQDLIIYKIQQERKLRESKEAEIHLQSTTHDLLEKEKEFKILMTSTSEEMIKKRRREDILFKYHQKIYSNKKLDISRILREEYEWESAIDEVNILAKEREEKISKVKDSLKANQNLKNGMKK